MPTRVKPAKGKTSATQFATPSAEPSAEQLQSAYEKAVKTYAHRSNVTGVDIGFRYKNGRRLESSGVRIHVEEKLPPSQLEADELFPESIDGVPIDVIQATYRPHAELSPSLEPETPSRKVRVDPLQPGVSVSHPSVTSGTFGAVVYDRLSGRRGLLSNWHVLVGSLDGKPGDPVVQPGRMWGGRAPRDTIGSLERFLLDGHGDAAVALLDTSRGVDPTQFESGVMIKASRGVKRGEIVEKSGATTGVTRGRVDGEGQYTLTYSVGKRTIRGFKIVAEKDGNPDGLEVSSGGDSGALWYSVDDGLGVGLHFAGETDPRPNEEHALACHLPAVLDQLSLALEPVSPTVVASDNDEQPEQTLPDESPASLPHGRLVVETVARLSRVLEAAVLHGAR